MRSHFTVLAAAALLVFGSALPGHAEDAATIQGAARTGRGPNHGPAGQRGPSVGGADDHRAACVTTRNGRPCRARCDRG